MELSEHESEEVIGALSSLYSNYIKSNPHQQKFVDIGNELQKVSFYANKYIIKDELSCSAVNTVHSAYFSTLTPLIRLELSLFVEAHFQNEYGHVLAARAYIEAVGRLHKSIRLWKSYDKKNITLDALLNGTRRLLATYGKNPENSANKKHPENSDAMLAPKEVTGYGVMTFIDCLEDAVPNIRKSYDDMSLYLHGDFFENMFTVKVTHFHIMKEGTNVTIKKHNKIVKSLRECAFCDFQFLLDLSLPLRTRWDASNTVKRRRKRIQARGPIVGD